MIRGNTTDFPQDVDMFTPGSLTPSHTSPAPSHTSSVTRYSKSNGDAENAETRQREKRTLRACDSCYRRKIKCDGVQPQCNWCAHHQLACTFTREKRPRRKKRKSQAEQKESELLNRIERLEKLLCESKSGEAATDEDQQTDHQPLAVSNNDRDISLSGHSPGIVGSGKIHFAGHRLGEFSLTHGLPLLSHESRKWMESCTGETDILGHLFAKGPPWQNQTEEWRKLKSSAPSTTRRVRKLPDRKIVEEYMRVYYSSFFRKVFPFFEESLTGYTLDKAYSSDNHLDREATVSKACIFSFLAFISSVGLANKESLPAIDAEECAAAGESIIGDIANCKPSTESLQSVMMMAFVHFTSGNFQTVDILLGLAARYVFMLGAHLYPALDLDHASSDSTSIINRTIIHRRNLFWLCYILDKELSFRTGFPPSINDTSCDLRPPTNYLDADTQSMPQYFPGDLRLSRIKSRAYNNLYSPQAMKRTDAEILKEIRELDDELEKWRISLPSVSRPSLTYSTESSKFSPFSSEDKIHVCLLRLEYYHCTAAIHQASNRCKTWFDKDSGVMEGVGSSLAISVEASRSTIRCLEASQDLLHDHIFWVLLFYPITAVLTLFFNVLHEPLHPMVALDLKLLKSAVCCLRQACSRTRGLAVNEVLHIKFVDDFVTELVRLARCAMDKAKQQQRETSGT